MTFSSVDLRMACLRFGDESPTSVERLRKSRNRWADRLQAIKAQVSVRGANALWVVGVWSPGELRRALKKTPNLLRYVQNCGSTTEQELIRWSAASSIEEPCPRCRGKGVIQRPKGLR